MKQHVKKSTRVTITSKTLIDHFYSNDKAYSVDVSQSDTIADHKSIIVYKTNSGSQYNFKKIIDRKGCVHENIIQLLSVEKLNYIPTNQLNYDLNYVKDKIETVASNLTSDKYISVSYAKRWYTGDLHELRKEKDRAHMTAQLNNESSDWDYYRLIRNRYNRMINRSRNDDIKQTMIECGDDKKLLWRCIKKHIGDKKELPTCVSVNGQLITDEASAANGLNLHFINSIKAINESIPLIPCDYNFDNTNVPIWDNFEPTTHEELSMIIRNIRTRSGLNNVNKNVMLSSMNVFGSEITELFNQSLSQGIFPDALKMTTVCPIPKVKDTCKAEEMRPINEAEVMDKMLQTVVKKQLQNHVDQNQLLSSNQSAYRENHSCETSLNLVMAKWKEYKESGKKIVAVFLDLSRAFETIDRNILMETLQRKGLSGNVLKWFRSFLQNRRQRTRYREHMSDTEFIEIGVPQGTPLSSLLFILYIDDIVKLLKYCSINLFADDMLIWIACDDVLDAIRKINHDLNVIYIFLCMLKLKVNKTKTKYMIIGTDVSDNVVIDGQSIEKVDEIKYLGIIVDDKLTFKSNIEYLIKKISKKIYLMQRLKNKTDFDTRLLLYNSLIAPHYDYCSTILFLASVTDIERLQKLQNRAMRIITNANPREHIVELLRQCKLLNVKQRIYFNVLCFMYKARQNELPQYLSSLFKTTAEVQPYDLRGNDLLRPPTYRSTLSQNSIQYKGAIEFNKMLSWGVKLHSESAEFKRQLNNYIVTKI